MFGEYVSQSFAGAPSPAPACPPLPSSFITGPGLRIRGYRCTEEDRGLINGDLSRGKLMRDEIGTIGMFKYVKKLHLSCSALDVFTHFMGLGMDKEKNHCIGLNCQVLGRAQPPVAASGSGSHKWALAQ